MVLSLKSSAQGHPFRTLVFPVNWLVISNQSMWLNNGDVRPQSQKIQTSETLKPLVVCFGLVELSCDASLNGFLTEADLGA